MEAFILEMLQGNVWQRSPTIYWSRADADSTATSLINRGSVKDCRVIPTTIHVDRGTPFNPVPNYETRMTTARHRMR